MFLFRVCFEVKQCLMPFLSENPTLCLDFKSLCLIFHIYTDGNNLSNVHVFLDEYLNRHSLLLSHIKTTIKLIWQRTFSNYTECMAEGM